MSAASRICWQMTFADLDNDTFSVALGAGPTPLTSPVGPPGEASGPGHVPANPSAASGSGGAAVTPGTSGRTFAASLRSAALQQSLESRLRARTDLHGSPEFALTWRRWTMPSGPPICVLRVTGRRTSGSDFIGSPTPTAQQIVMKVCYGDRLIKAPSGVTYRSALNGSRYTANWSLWVLHSGYLPTPKLCGFWMGYPIAWQTCTGTGTRSSRKSPPRSSARSSKRRK